MDATARLLVSLSDPEGNSPGTVGDSIDWERFNRLALHHGVYPLVGRSNREWNGLPEAVAMRAREEERQAFARAHFYLRLARHYMDILEKNGVETLLLKGPTIAFYYYPSPELRPFTDIDLYIHERDKGKLKDILGSAGLRLKHPELEEFFLRTRSQFEFVDEANNISIEIHWNFVNSRSLHTGLALPEELIWGSRQVGNAEGVVLPMLSPECAFVQLCIHQTFQHQFEKLLWLIDVLVILRREGNDAFWEMVENGVATSSGARTAIHACLRYLDHLYPGSMDATPMADFRPRSIPPRALSSLLGPESLMDKDSWVLKVKRKAFRQALKY